MKIIIIGLGRTGHMLISAMASDNHDISVIDKDAKLIDHITDTFSVNGYVGSGASRETLLAAGAATADAIVALTPVDEINLLSCMQAKSLGTRLSAARISMVDFAKEQDYLKKEYNIDTILRPLEDVAEEIYHNVGMPGFTKLIGFWRRGIHLMDLNVPDDSPLCGHSLNFIKKTKEINTLVVAALRDGKLIIPDGEYIVEPGDNLTLVISRDELEETLPKLGIRRKTVRKAMIIGGGVITGYLLDLLEKDGIQVTVIDWDPDRCRYLMECHQDSRIMYAGNSEPLEILREENINKMDMVMSLTDRDETNLVTSMYAWSAHIPSIVTCVAAPEHLRLLHRVNIDITVSPVESAALRAMRFIRRNDGQKFENEIGKFYIIAEGLAEIKELTAGADFLLLNIQFKERRFRLKKNVLIAAIFRGGNLIVPSGDTTIQEGDKVIVAVSRKQKVQHLNDIAG